ncbi:aldo/keto reductase [Synechocystis salina LEGE 06099]|nr:aldo/keto reductase [Synechocystis salina LEGE 06099]
MTFPDRSSEKFSNPMLYRRFGRTELSMPVFSCGGMRYQFQWQDAPFVQVPKDNQHNLQTTIERSLELGINHIETARGYGTSEMQLGKILPRLPREKLIVQTKVSPKDDPKEFRREFDKSLGYLNLDYVDLLGIHGINNRETLEQSLRPGGCLDVCRQLQREGRVRFVGFSTHGPTAIITEAINSGEFDYVNLHWYYIFQDNWPAIAAATEQDMGVFIISPSDKGGQLYNPPQKLVHLCQPLSPMVFNNLFCLSHPQVHTLSIGASRPTDFDEHLKTLPYLASERETEKVLQPILARLHGAMVEALGEDWVNGWRIGLPSPEQTPGEINIPKILWLYNLCQGFDLVEYSKMRYNLLGNGGHWFPGQPASNFDEQKLWQCLAPSPQRRRVLEVLRETDRLLKGETVQRLSRQEVAKTS